MARWRKTTGERFVEYSRGNKAFVCQKGRRGKWILLERHGSKGQFLDIVSEHRLKTLCTRKLEKKVKR